MTPPEIKAKILRPVILREQKGSRSSGAAVRSALAFCDEIDRLGRGVHQASFDPIFGGFIFFVIVKKGSYTKCYTHLAIGNDGLIRVSRVNAYGPPSEFSGKAEDVLGNAVAALDGSKNRTTRECWRLLIPLGGEGWPGSPIPRSQEFWMIKRRIGIGASAADLLDSLETLGPSTPAELMEDTGRTSDQVYRVLDRILGHGFVKVDDREKARASVWTVTLRGAAQLRNYEFTRVGGGRRQIQLVFRVRGKHLQSELDMRQEALDESDDPAVAALLLAYDGKAVQIRSQEHLVQVLEGVNTLSNLLDEDAHGRELPADERRVARLASLALTTISEKMAKAAGMRTSGSNS